MSKKCTPLWHEAHFEVKMLKTPHVRTTFQSCDVEKSARRCGAKHISKSKCANHTVLGPFLEVETSKKCTPLWREAHFEVKMYKTHHVRTTFWRFRCRFAWQAARDCAPCQKRAKREGFVAFPKTMAGVGHLKKICN